MERFWSKVEKTETCWLWTGYRDPQGYGRFKIAGKAERAHRLSYMLLVGPIPSELLLDHLCRNRACLRPDHLEPKTNRENTLCGVSVAAENAKLTACRRGHPFDEKNTVIERYAHGVKRKCRTCKRERSQLVRQRLDAPQRAGSIPVALTETRG